MQPRLIPAHASSQVSLASPTIHTAAPGGGGGGGTRDSQFDPWNPAGQAHAYASAPSKHSAPFWHGLDAHSSEPMCGGAGGGLAHSAAAISRGSTSMPVLQVV
jgi:hypothetical protein